MKLINTSNLEQKGRIKQGMARFPSMTQEQKEKFSDMFLDSTKKAINYLHSIVLQKNRAREEIIDCCIDQLCKLNEEYELAESSEERRSIRADVFQYVSVLNGIYVSVLNGIYVENQKFIGKAIAVITGGVIVVVGVTGSVIVYCLKGNFDAVVSNDSAA